jgi:N-acetyl-anhydromuramyl-L-alanine amidase AmpD
MTHPLDNMKTPEVKFNKNGYEIRADILALAKDQVVGEFQAKFAGWEMRSKRDEKTGQLVTEVAMPDYPGVDKILEAAEKMYSFVNAGIKK